MNNFLSLTKNISIVIPTMDRPEFMERNLHYYAKTGFKGCILIGDSSSDVNFEKTANVKKSIDHDFDIIHKFIPRDKFNNSGLVIREVSKMIDTDYVCFSGDDDFLIPKTLGECVHFLNNNHDFAGAHGHRINFKLNDNNIYYGTINSIQKITVPCIQHDNASKRFLEYMRNPISIQYHVFRQDIWKTAYNKISKKYTRYFGEEILPCSIGAILGKYAKINKLQTVFQIQNMHHFSWDSQGGDQNMLLLLTNKNFSITYHGLLNAITNELIKKEKIDHNIAHELVQKEIWNHLNRFMIGHYEDKYNENTRGNSNKIIKILKGIYRFISLKKFYRYFKNTIRYNELSLKKLKNLSHPCSNDFMTIFNHLENKSNSINN